jgi:hypothetical protein
MGVYKKPPDIRVRGVRQTIPPGYVLGRVSGDGQAQLISFSDLNSQLSAADGSTTTTIKATANADYQFLGWLGDGPFASNDQYELPPGPRAVVFPSASAPAARSVAYAQTPATADYTFVLVSSLAHYLANGSSVLATIKFTAGQNVGSITYTAGTVALQGQPYLVMPATADATLAGVSLQFVGDPA